MTVKEFLHLVIAGTGSLRLQPGILRLKLSDSFFQFGFLGHGSELVPFPILGFLGSGFRLCLDIKDRAPDEVL